MRTTGQPFLHSWMHLEGLHFSELTMAIRVSVSSSLEALSFFLGAMPRGPVTCARRDECDES